MSRTCVAICIDGTNPNAFRQLASVASEINAILFTLCRLLQIAQLDATYADGCSVCKVLLVLHSDGMYELCTWMQFMVFVPTLAN